MIAKPRAFILRIDRTVDEVMVCDSSRIIQIEATTDLNSQTIVVKTDYPDLFKRVETRRFADGKTVNIPVNDSFDSKPTFTFLFYQNYNGYTLTPFWKDYEKIVASSLPKNYSKIREAIISNHSINTDTVARNVRVYSDTVINKSYVDSDGLYTFEFIPLLTKLGNEAPLIPPEDTLDLYSKTSGIKVEDIKERMYRRFGYVYRGYTPKGAHTNLTLADVQDQIKLMLSIHMQDYGITTITHDTYFTKISKLDLINYTAGTTLKNLLEKERKTYMLRVWQDHPFGIQPQDTRVWQVNQSGELYRDNYYRRSNNYHLWLQNLSEFVKYPAGRKAKWSLMSTFGNNDQSKSIFIGYSDIINQNNPGLYDLITDISVKQPDANNNAFLISGSSQFAAGIKLKADAVVKMAEFGKTGNYDVYVRATLNNDSNVEYNYGTKYLHYKYSDGKKSVLNSSMAEYNANSTPKPNVSITCPLPSPFSVETNVTADLIASGITTTLDRMLDHIKANGSQAYRMDMELQTPLFNNDCGDVVYVNQIYPYNTDGNVRQKGDMVLYKVSVDRIVETISPEGHSFNVHAATGDIAERNISFIGSVSKPEILWEQVG